MPTIAILSNDPLMASFFIDAFRLEGWIPHPLPSRDDGSRIAQILTRDPPDLLLIEFHPDQWSRSRYARVLRAMHDDTHLRTIPILISHYHDESLDGLRPLLAGHATAVLTHAYDLDSLYATARHLVSPPT